MIKTDNLPTAGKKNNSLLEFMAKMADPYMKKYTNMPISIQQKTRNLIYINFWTFLLLSILAATAPFYLINEAPIMRFSQPITFLASAILSLISLFLLRKGHNRPASILTALFFFLIFTLVPIIVPFEHRFIIFLFTALYSILMMIITVIGYNKLMPIVFSILTSVVILVVFIAYLNPLEAGITGDNTIEWKDLGPAFGIVIGSGLICTLSMHNSLSLVQKAEKEAEINRIKSKQIEGLLNASRENMQIGQVLLNSTDAMTQTSNTIVSIMKELKQDSHQLDTQIEASVIHNKEILNSTDTMKNSVEDQNTNIIETTATIEQMASSIKKLSENSNEKFIAIEHLVETTEKGSNRIMETIQSIDKIADSSKSMKEVITVITDISEKTNLLAMNASIEAAHAGDRGRGFAVVASEIRKLSEETNLNIRKITDTLNENVDAVRKAREFNTTTEISFNNIMKEVKSFATVIEELNEGLNEYSLGTQEILKAIINIKNGTSTVDDSVNKIIPLNKNISESITNSASLFINMNTRLDSTIRGFDSIRANINDVNIIGNNNIEIINRLDSEISTLHNK